MLAGLPPSTRTDLAVDMLGGTTVLDRGDHLVVRTASNPGYHWGNFVQVTSGDPDDASRWLSAFSHEFPDARHRAIGLLSEPDPAAWQGTGLRHDTVEALTTRTAPSRAALPDGYEVHRLTSDADWGDRLVAELRENERTGAQDPAAYREFVTRQLATRRRLVEAGDAAWFGAFDERGEHASSLGIVVLRDLHPVTARYQTVLTGADHRRRGLARHLLSVAAGWAMAEGAEELVIVADAGSAAGRLYARAGFAPGPLAHGRYAPSV